MKNGAKFDSEKLRFDLLEVGPIRAVIRVLMLGAQRYGDRNYKRVPYARKRYYSALMRHATAWWSGERKDPDSGENHMAHCAVNALFLLWFDGVK